MSSEHRIVFSILACRLPNPALRYSQQLFSISCIGNKWTRIQLKRWENILKWEIAFPLHCYQLINDKVSAIIQRFALVTKSRLVKLALRGSKFMHTDLVCQSVFYHPVTSWQHLLWKAEQFPPPSLHYICHSGQQSGGLSQFPGLSKSVLNLQYIF